MPLTLKGQKIKRAMEKEYGEKKGEQVFYASENKGTIKGVAKSQKAKSKALGLKIKHTDKGRAGNISYLGR